jgi:hypothetical protein
LLPCPPHTHSMQVEKETIPLPTTANCPTCQLSLATVRSCQHHWVAEHHPELAAALPEAPPALTTHAAAATVDESTLLPSGPRESEHKSLVASPVAGESVTMEADDEGSPSSERRKRCVSLFRLGICKIWFDASCRSFPKLTAAGGSRLMVSPHLRRHARI